MRERKYLNDQERFLIEVELAAGATKSEIARKLHRARVTIIREIKRGSCEQINPKTGKVELVYKSDYAQLTHKRRVSKKGTGLKIDKDFATAEMIENLIKNNHWSPAAALGYLRNHDMLNTSICVATLYNYINSHALNLTRDDLPRRGKQRKQNAKTYNTAHRNPRGTSIEERPKEVLERKEFGHWEGDLIVGRLGSRTVFLTLLERKTRKLIAVRLESKQACNVVHALDNLEHKFGLLFPTIFKSITFDNGNEFSQQAALETSRYKCRQKHGKRTHIYYAHPYCSCERGSNENCNGLLRRAGLKKKANLGSILNYMDCVDWVNDLPRQIFGYHSAREMFELELNKIKNRSA